MKKIKVIQHLSMAQWRALWSAYWRLWPMVLRIKFKQFSKDASWIAENITFVQNEPLIQEIGVASQDNTGRSGLLKPTDQLEPVEQLEFDRQFKLAKQFHESVRLAARLHFFPAHCLPRSLVLANMLKAHDIDAHVYIGVSKKDNGFASHAWIEVCKQMVVEPEAVGHDFTRLNG